MCLKVTVQASMQLCASLKERTVVSNLLCLEPRKGPVEATWQPVLPPSSDTAAPPVQLGSQGGPRQKGWGGPGVVEGGGYGLMYKRDVWASKHLIYGQNEISLLKNRGPVA